ncbi:LOW QUALITY PROTEIN: Hypothetical protein PHPALM_6223 [Phytophthora palmivora]|uniref:DDE-1 domain-containing protein n=1 Tax=Phytophthora palmivora TaxID=4796 RepID=A0A2P4YFD3_9STRA|nr:LOW QUALITY PROTEIN: Hypothetical protein PHPALM_6223 [Phytophthora palmivora]
MFAKAGDRFSENFNSATRPANLQKATDSRRRSSTKVVGGREDRDWNGCTHIYLKNPIASKTGCEIRTTAFLAKQISRDSPEGYNARSADDKGALVIDKISSRWVQTFMETREIVFTTQFGKTQLSEARPLHIEKFVAFRLDELRRGVEDGSLDEDVVGNLADVVGGAEGMSMIVRLSGGASANFTPTMISMNAEGSIQFAIISEKKAIRANTRRCKKTVFPDNCSGYLEANECREELNAINSDLTSFPPNAPGLYQPVDSLVIAKIKDAWKVKWNEKKMALLKSERWQNTVQKDWQASKFRENIFS